MQKVDECLSLFSVFFNRTKVYILFHRFTFFKWFHGVNTVQRDMPKSQLSFKRNLCYCCFVWLIFISVHLTITTNMIKHNRDLHGWNNKNKIITIYYSAALSYLATLIRHIELALPIWQPHIRRYGGRNLLYLQKLKGKFHTNFTAAGQGGCTDTKLEIGIIFGQFLCSIFVRKKISFEI